ncbi:hypothetical protein NKG94_08820 [Micromonospora sp. M12]
MLTGQRRVIAPDLRGSATAPPQRTASTPRPVPTTCSAYSTHSTWTGPMWWPSTPAYPPPSCSARGTRPACAD